MRKKSGINRTPRYNWLQSWSCFPQDALSISELFELTFRLAQGNQSTGLQKSCFWNADLRFFLDTDRKIGSGSEFWPALELRHFYHFAIFARTFQWMSFHLKRQLVVFFRRAKICRRTLWRHHWCYDFYVQHGHSMCISHVHTKTF